MDISNYMEKWQGREVVAFCGPIKYRGIFEEITEDSFLVLSKAAVINIGAGDTIEYDNCILNISEISGIASEEVVGRGAELAEES